MWPEGIFLLPFPPLPSFSASLLKEFSPPALWIFCKLKENALGPKTRSQRHRLPAGASQRSRSFSVALLKSFSLSQYAPKPCSVLWATHPIMGARGEQAAGTFEKLALVPLVVSQMVCWLWVLEEEFPSVLGVFCLAPLTKATDTQSLQGEHTSILDPWTHLWLSRILLWLSRKF